MNNNDLISPKEAAERLGVAAQTVLRWIATGSIKALRCGRKTIRVSWTEVVAQLRERSQRDAAPGGAS